MNSNLQLNALGEECLRLAGELNACLAEEREALIELNIEKIVQTNFRKDDLGRQLAEQRRNFSTLAKALGTLPENWVERWSPAWQAMETACKQNQKFISHSLKNLSLIVDNLKRLFGESSTYTPAGKKHDSNTAGKMVEAKY